jgi:Helix-turn-helix domain
VLEVLSWAHLGCGVTLSPPSAASPRAGERVHGDGHAMPRSENPIDQAAGPLAEFAAQLRALRVAAGTISYRSMAVTAHYSSTVLSRAASGRRMPTWLAVAAYVHACGGDPVEWRARWEALRSTYPRQPGPHAGCSPSPHQPGLVP